VTVRVWDYEDFTAGSRIVLDEGTLDTFRTGGLLNGAFTIVAVFKRSADTTESVQYLISFNANTSVRTGLSLTENQPDTELQFELSGIGVTFDLPVDDDTWYVAAVRFPGTASSVPQARLWDLDHDTDSGWVDGSTDRDPDNNAITTIELGNRPNDFPFNGKVAAAGAYSVSIGTAGDDLDLAPASWSTTDLVAQWVLDQASTATAVSDLVGDADQTSITGTLVDTEDDPPYRSAGGTGATATPAALAATLALPAATTSAGSTPGPAALAATLAFPAAATAASGDRIPDPLAAAVALPAAAVTASSAPIPAALAAVLALPAATVHAAATVTPAPLALTLGLPAASVTAGGSATAAPDPLALSLGVPVTALSAGSTATPAALTLTVATPAATTAGGTGSTATPAALAMAATFPPAGLAAGATTTPAVLELAATLARPAIPSQEDARGAGGYLATSSAAGRITASTPPRTSTSTPGGRL
jgi:hypothetical protein